MVPKEKLKLEPALGPCVGLSFWKLETENWKLLLSFRSGGGFRPACMAFAFQAQNGARFVGGGDFKT